MNQSVEQPVSGEARDRRSRGHLDNDWWRNVFAGALALILGIGALWALRLLAWPLALLIGGIAVAAALNPLVGWLERWLPRAAAVILIYLLMALILVGIGWLVVPTIVNQFRSAFDQLPSIIDQFEQRLNRWIPMADGIRLPDLVPAGSTDSGGTPLLLALPRRILEWIVALVVVIFVSLYGLILAPKAHAFLRSLFPSDRWQRVSAVLSKTADAMGGYVRGTMIDAVIVGIITYVGLLIIGYEYAIVLGVLAGLLEIIPVIGPFITAVLIVSFGLLQSTNLALIGLVFALILQQVETNILVPNIMKGQAHLSPLMVLLAILSGERIGGLVGALVAIPLIAGLRVIVVEVVAPAVRNWTGAPPEPEGDESNG